MQHLKMVYYIVDCNLEYLSTVEEEHWEAFPIGSRQSEPEFPKDPVTGVGLPFHDKYEDKSGQTRQCTFGAIYYEAEFKYFDFPLPIPPFQIGGCRTAGIDQPCTTVDPSKADPKLAIPKGGSGKHNVKVTWDCCCPCCGVYRDWIGWPSF